MIKKNSKKIFLLMFVFFIGMQPNYSYCNLFPIDKDLLICCINNLMSFVFVGAVIFFLNRKKKVNPFFDSSFNNLPVVKKSSKYVNPPQQILTLIDCINNPSKYQEMKIVCPRGFLLVGPPGSGKTALARFISFKADCPFFEICGSDIIKPYVGQGSELLRDLFTRAEQGAENSPKKTAIIFIDEIDVIGNRSSVNSRGGPSSSVDLVNTLLGLMDGFEQPSYNCNIVIIGATNKVQVIDSALKRSGRFETIIEFNYPTNDVREKIIEIYLKEMPVDKTISAGQLVDLTENYNAADIKSLFQRAGIDAVQKNRKTRGGDNFLRAYEQIHTSKNVSPLTQEERICIIEDNSRIHSVMHLKVKDIVEITNNLPAESIYCLFDKVVKESNLSLESIKDYAGKIEAEIKAENSQRLVKKCQQFYGCENSISSTKLEKYQYAPDKIINYFKQKSRFFFECKRALVWWNAIE